jgi:hypothetical protein
MSGVDATVKNLVGLGSGGRRKDKKGGKFGKLTPEEKERISKSRGRVGGVPVSTLLNSGGNERLGG